MAEGINVEFPAELSKLEKGLVLGVLSNRFILCQMALSQMALTQARQGEDPQATSFEAGQIQALLNVREFAKQVFPHLELVLTLRDGRSSSESPQRKSPGSSG